jgi:CubicO group peptidase (beta-lactamase class C family)
MDTMTGFAATRVAFDKAVAKQEGVGGASFSVTADGGEVLTLFGGSARPGVPWTHDTRTVTMSIAKGFCGIVAAMLADRGLLDPDERVATYWPEFAANGKQDVLVRHILLHEAGTIGLPRVADVLQWDGGGWDDLDAIAAALAASEPAWAPGTAAGYHAVTYGWLVGELVRRIDGRTVGTFFREEVAEPLGIRTAIGVPASEQGDVARIHGEGMDRAPFPLRGMNNRSRKAMRDPSKLIGKAAIGDGSVSIFDTPNDLMNNPRWLAAEVPAANGVTSAHDLARLFSLIACGGELDGVRLLSTATLERFSAPSPCGHDIVLASAMGPVMRRVARSMLTPNRTMAFMGNDPANGPQSLGPSARAVGAGGYGGQLVMADPERRVSMAFMRSALLWGQKEVSGLVSAVYEDLGTGT